MSVTTSPLELVRALPEQPVETQVVSDVVGPLAVGTVHPKVRRPQVHDYCLEHKDLFGMFLSRDGRGLAVSASELSSVTDIVEAQNLLAVTAQTLPEEIAALEAEGGGASLDEAAIKKSLNEHARALLIDSFEGLIRTIAPRFAAAARSHTFDDFVQWGRAGVLKGAEAYDPELGNFASYVGHHIRKEMIREGLEKTDAMRRQPRDVSDRRRQITIASRDLEEELQRAPTEEEIAERAGVSLEELAQHRFSTDTGSLNESAHQDSSQSAEVGDFIPMAGPSLESQAINNVILTKLYDILDGTDTGPKLTHLEILVLTRHFVDGVKQEVIGEEVGHSQSYISRVSRKALMKIRTHLLEQGIDGVHED